MFGAAYPALVSIPAIPDTDEAAKLASPSSIGQRLLKKGILIGLTYLALNRI